MEKPSWTKPQLIALVRSTPEEAILSNCKGTATGSAYADDGNCVGDGNGRCNACATIGAS